VAEKIDENLWDQCRDVTAAAPDNAPPGGMGLLLGEIDGIKVKLMDGNWVRTNVSMEFHEAGNGMFTSWEKGLIPKGEAWLDDTVKSDNYKFDLYHELYEIRLMREGLDYDAVAHPRANAAEKILRRRWGNTDTSYRE